MNWSLASEMKQKATFWVLVSAVQKRKKRNEIPFIRIGVGYTGQENRFRWHKVFWMCLGIRRKKNFFFWKKCIFQGLQSKTVRAKWPFWAVYSNFTPSVLKKYLNDVSETYRYHDMVIHLCKFKISDLYLFFHGPGGVGNDCAKH